MTVRTERIKLREKNEDGTAYSAELVLPKAEGDCEISERLNGFYGKIGDRLIELAKESLCRVITECRIFKNKGERYSLYIDIFYYKDGALIACRRISDSRDCEGNIIPCPKEIRGKIPRGGGWYFFGERAFVYENSFTPGDEQGVRRSEYYKFFKERSFEIKPISNSDSARGVS